ncbi:MAG: ParB/RepB/Spo0J family partition protein [Deltaproteobacteria bacterium]|jgi:ParB family chromosome partitioning protein|nr:ParB/RepB/Spo0J family partition protein [Deltaproteobacteria bacterium]MBW1853625.1 ParB/RepB/Spo0J family partition protein [Deltaproteobacteria bacterium]MBW2182275.1 ParB/RepB/Spo0J family partition protein [Deltaproteobacteria bacterium]MCK5420716.1 ParB/RepB/Spo0J family partition protein [Deltaproteobacteria bacterium]
MAERKALGKGLGALIPDIEDDLEGKEGALYCNLDEIQVNPYQPRTVFDQEKIEELTHSIKEKGVIQPLLVRKVKGGYQLVAGERRLRAAKKAGLEKIPVVVREISKAELLEYSLIENLQRENLNPIEEAEAYKRLMKDFGYTQQQVSQVLGKNRATVANQLRLLKLPGMVKKSLALGEISMGHARGLLSLSELQKVKEAFRIVVGKGLSVRETEKLVKRLSQEKIKKEPEKRLIHLEYVRNDLRQWLGTQVKIVKSGKKGKIIIEFYSSEELERIIERIKGR